MGERWFIRSAAVLAGVALLAGFLGAVLGILAVGAFRGQSPPLATDILPTPTPSPTATPVPPTATPVPTPTRTPTPVPQVTLKEIFDQNPGLQWHLVFWRCQRQMNGQDPNSWADFREHARKLWFASTGSPLELPVTPPVGWPDDLSIQFQIVGQFTCWPLDPSLRKEPSLPPPGFEVKTFGPYNLGHAGEAHAVRYVDLGVLDPGTRLEISLNVGFSASLNYLLGGDPDVRLAIIHSSGYAYDFGRVGNGFRTTWFVDRKGNWWLVLDNNHSRLAGKDVTVQVAYRRAGGG